MSRTNDESMIPESGGAACNVPMSTTRPGMHYSKHKITGFAAGEKVVWTVLESRRGIDQACNAS